MYNFEYVRPFVYIVQTKLYFDESLIISGNQRLLSEIEENVL